MIKAISEFEIDKVTIVLDGTPVILMDQPENMNRWKHGECKNGQILLTIEEAEALAQHLLSAAEDLRRMNQELNEYMNNQEE